jgi:hypothetical protein
LHEHQGFIVFLSRLNRRFGGVRRLVGIAEGAFS